MHPALIFTPSDALSTYATARGVGEAIFGHKGRNARVEAGKA